MFCSSASETLLKVLMRQGEHWEPIQEVILSPESPRLSISKSQPAKMNGTQPMRTVGYATEAKATLRGRDRFRLDKAIVTLQLLLLVANALLLRSNWRIRREAPNLQPFMDQIGALTAAVSKLQPAAVDPLPQTIPVADQQPSQQSVPPKQISKALVQGGRFAITAKPTILRPSETFQFKINGYPAPAVVWSAKGPGSIDRDYGVYTAPNEFTGETKVKVIATSWKGAQSVTFTLTGAPPKEHR